MNDAVTVRVTGLECFGYHGVFPEEKENGQRFVVDLEMYLAELASTQSDHLADTVDYEAVAETIATIVGGPPVDLLEHLASIIADRVMEDPRLSGVAVTVRKPQVKLAQSVTETSVTLRRSR
jgi:7,8-dihydroneopterin aldolase/epimerase/oxygenase